MSPGRRIEHSGLWTIAAFAVCLAACGAAETPAPVSAPVGANQPLVAGAEGSPARVDAATSATSPALSDDALDASVPPLAVAPPDASSTDEPCEYASQRSRPAPRGPQCVPGDASTGCPPPPCTVLPTSLTHDGPVRHSPDVGALLDDAKGIDDTPAERTRMFNRGAAAASLGAVNLSKCAAPGGPFGEGHVKITFAPSGKVSSIEVDSPPFAGTGVGGCIADKFRGARIPTFDGGAVTIGKSFTLR
jgi:hypothetical protein